MSPEALEARNAAIRKAWDDPLRRALMSVAKGGVTGRRRSRAALNAYYRNYLKKWREKKRCDPA
jgi:hypothetical protein